MALPSYRMVAPPYSSFPACDSVGETTWPSASGLSSCSLTQVPRGLARWVLKATPVVDIGPALCVSPT